jgi:hypothetical protein
MWKIRASFISSPEKCSDGQDENKSDNRSSSPYRTCRFNQLSFVNCSQKEYVIRRIGVSVCRKCGSLLDHSDEFCEDLAHLYLRLVDRVRDAVHLFRSMQSGCKVLLGFHKKGRDAWLRLTFQARRFRWFRP